jgi:DNA-binding winged helix-turn-helix (wHTH) protein
MERPQSKPQHIIFYRFEMDLGSGRLFKNGRKDSTTTAAFRFLELMLARPGELVTREEVCRALWNSTTFVDFDHSLGAAMNKIREALGDSAGSSSIRRNAAAPRLSPHRQN